jgi:hypothetical protein
MFPYVALAKDKTWQGEKHGPHIARTEVISLTAFDGPLTVI